MEKNNQANSKERITKLHDELEVEQSAMDPCSTRINLIRCDLLKAYRDEENYWKQKSKDDWIIHGDGNTKVFHAAVKAARAKNEVVKLIDLNGVAHRSEASKAQVAINYFQDLFKSSNSEDYSEILRGFPSKISERMNHCLIKKVTPEEVKNAVFSIKAGSAPRVDGMTGFFFQNYWSIVGDQLTKEVIHFFDSGIMPAEWNYTQLCLIPKKPNATLMTDSGQSACAQ